MIISDVRGRDEDIEGKVFAGQNLLLLEKMLEAIGLWAHSTSSFNFIPWRSPGNRTPTEAEIECRPYIMRAIELCRPKFISALAAIRPSACQARATGFFHSAANGLTSQSGRGKFR